MIDKKGLLSALLLLSILLFGSCSAGRNFIFIIDTSGSMQEKNLLQEVKRSVKKIMLDYKSGDRFHVISFDSATSFLFSREIKNNNDLQLVFDEIDKLEALGQWTNLVQVLDYSLGKVVELQKKDPGSRTVLVVYTDGKNDPPPVLRGKKNISFTELFNKYYLNKALKKSWYIYYVELDQPEPELAAFLKDNDTGVVISKESFSSNVNFTIDEKTDYALYIWIASGILLVLLLIYFFHPWFRMVNLVPLGDAGAGGDRTNLINLGGFRKKFFSDFLSVGSKGDVRISGPNIAEKHAAIGVNYRGGFYLKPLSKELIKVDNKVLTDKQTIKPGQVIQIGSKKFMFEKTSK